jgi:hypothetical protein
LPHPYHLFRFGVCEFSSTKWRPHRIFHPNNPVNTSVARSGSVFYNTYRRGFPRNAAKIFIQSAMARGITRQRLNRN